MFEPERFRRVEQDDVEIPRNPSMLESVVKNQNIGVLVCQKIFGGGNPVRILSMFDVWKLERKLQKLVVDAVRGFAVSATDDSRSQTPVEKKPTEPGDHRSFAGSSERQVADRNDRNRRSSDLKKSVIVKKVAERNNRSVRNFKNVQSGSQQRRRRAAFFAADQFSETIRIRKVEHSVKFSSRFFGSRNGGVLAVMTVHAVFSVNPAEYRLLSGCY